MSDVITELAMEANDKTAEIARLKAENAKLLEELDAAKQDLQVFSANLARLGAENAKLRELLTFYLGCLTKGHVNCNSCAFAEDVCKHGRKVIDWARDLGVEVGA